MRGGLPYIAPGYRAHNPNAAVIMLRIILNLRAPSAPKKAS
jgi:hypothetical protein